MDTKGILLWGAFLIIIAAGTFFSRRTKKQIDEDGIETTGVISRITEEGSPEEVDTHVYVRYTTEYGDEVEGIISNPRSDLTVGQKVRIKYHPKYTMNARVI